MIIKFSCNKCGQRLSFEDEHHAASSQSRLATSAVCGPLVWKTAQCQECNQVTDAQTEIARIIVQAMLSSGEIKVENDNRLALLADLALKKLLMAARWEREKLPNGKEAFVYRYSFIADMQRIGKEQGLDKGDGKSHSVADLTSHDRLGLIWDMQDQITSGYVRYKSETTTGAKHVRPAWELVRIAPVMVPRNWQERWEKGGGTTYPGTGLDGGPCMVALKTDDIWEKISRFGVPWPPFDFGSCVGVRGVSYDECRRLGVIGANWKGRQENRADVVFDLDVFARMFRQHFDWFVSPAGQLAEQRS